MQWLNKTTESNKKLKDAMIAQRLREKHYKEVKVIEFYPEYPVKNTTLLIHESKDPEKAAAKFIEGIKRANNPLKK